MSPVFRDEELSEYGETVMLRREEMRDAVYDAAMALVQHEIDMMEQGVKNPTDWDRYYDALHDACRRAKEGR